MGLASRHGGVKCSLISARTKTLLNYVTKRRNRSSDSSADGRVESPEAKKAKNADNLEILAANREHAGDASEEDSDIVLTALELTDDLSEILKGILEKVNKLDTIERAIKKIEGSLVKLEERTTKLEALDCKEILALGSRLKGTNFQMFRDLPQELVTRRSNLKRRTRENN